LTIGVKKCRVAKLMRSRTGFSCHLPAVM
jgi:hypothetical protein